MDLYETKPINNVKIKRLIMGNLKDRRINERLKQLTSLSKINSIIIR